MTLKQWYNKVKLGLHSQSDDQGGIYVIAEQLKSMAEAIKILDDALAHYSLGGSTKIKTPQVMIGSTDDALLVGILECHTHRAKGARKAARKLLNLDPSKDVK